MSIAIEFHGAAGTVTGSCYRITHPGGVFLVDCGLFQGPKTLKALNYNAFPFDPATLDCVLLTHAHIDHSGLLPKLIGAGFRGPILTTRGSIDLLRFMLPDSGNIQEMEVERLNRRNARRGREEVVAIYTRADAEAAIERLRPIEYGGWIDAAKGLRARFWNAGHILGAASIEVEIATGDTARPVHRLLFSGDLGPEHKLFHPDPHAPADFDHIVVEATYGDRERQTLTPEARRALLRDEVKAAMRRGGNLIIPAFAVERSQELLTDLIHLFDRGEVGPAAVYLDSPMAVQATRTFMQHAAELEDVSPGDAFTSPHIRLVEKLEESIAIGRIRAGAIIISASGMCDAGRIRDHLRNNLWRAESTILLVGYQAPGTLGSLLEQGARAVRIQGDQIVVRAAIRKLDAYSGHADRGELVDWVRERLPVRGGLFLTHGEEAALAGLRAALIEAGVADAQIGIPKLDDCFVLSDRAGIVQTPTVHRLPAEVVGQLDWHNAHSAFLLALDARLGALESDRARTELLRRLTRDLQGERR